MKKMKPTWDSFCAKYQGEALQRERFEDLSRALFCERYGIKYGIFQCINHAGNETDPIAVGGELIGFSAKYFKNAIDPDQINHSLQVAHERYPSQTVQIIYCNKTFGNSTNSSRTTMTRKQQLVVDKAKSLGMKIEWVTDNMILDSVMQVDWIYDYFFAYDSELELTIKRENSNADSVFSPIRTEILSDKYTIRIDYSIQVDKIKDAINNNTHLVIYGEGGCGKTALMKSVWQEIKDEIPVCIRKAQDIKASNLDNLFVAGVDNFFKSYDNCDNKVFIIDSAERIQGLEDISVFESLLSQLVKHKWTIVFTVRSSYMQTLQDDLRFTYFLKTSLISIDSLTQESLSDLSKQYGFELPDNDAFCERLNTLFYLNLYLQSYDSIDRKGSYSNFANLIWQNKIGGKSIKCGISIKRSNTFESFIEKRIERDSFYLSDRFFDPEAIQNLLDDEVLGRNDNGIFITHDIYEEWGLNKIIDRRWAERKSILAFFENLGTSFLVRKSFRLWLTAIIDSDESVIHDILNHALDDSISQIWRDEIVVGIMQSSFAGNFLSKVKSELFTNDAKLLNRIIFLLRIACKKLKTTFTSEGYDYPIYTPYGSGWSAIIHLLFENEVEAVPVRHKYQILKEWAECNPTGNTTREAGLMALVMWQKGETGEFDYYDHSIIEILCNITINSAKEIKEELHAIVEKIIVNKWNSHRDPYYELFHYVLSKPQFSFNLIAVIPDDIISIIDLFWTYIKVDPNDEFEWRSYSHSKNNHYGLNHEELEYRYGPAYAFQTPIYPLLFFHYWRTVEYIVSFTNRIIDYILKNGESHEQLTEVAVYMGDEQTIQYGNYALWGLYRGAVHITFPDVLESMHMALEKVLLEFSDDEKYDKIVSSTLNYLLKNSKSVSLTAIVSSIVFSHPEKYWRYAVDLFRSVEFFHWDSIRLSDENQLSWFYGMAGMLSKEAAKERFATLKQKFRHKCLESLCTEMQYSLLKGHSDEDFKLVVKTISSVLDNHYEKAKLLYGEDKKIVEILLHRIDRRKHSPKVTQIGGNQLMIELNPQLPEELKQYSEDSIQTINNSMKYSYLITWCQMKLEGKSESSVYKRYEDNPLNAITDSKEILKEIASGRQLMPMDLYAPNNAAGVLISFYDDMLNQEDALFCKEIIDNIISVAISGNYYAQMSDGLEASIHAVPNLIRMYPDEKVEYIERLSKVLCVQQDLGAYKRVCDYVIEAITQKGDNDLLNLVIGYYLRTAIKQDYLIDKASPLSESMLTELEKLDIESAEVMLELIQNKPEDKLFQKIVLRLMPYFAQTTMQEDYHNAYHPRYDRHWNLYKAIAHYVLCQEIHHVEQFISPCFKYLDGGSNAVYFVRAFVHEENIMNRPNIFWKVWELLFDNVMSNDKYCDEMTITYLLADQLSMPETKEWHSFNDSNFWLYDKAVVNYGNNPSVVFSISKSLNYIAAKYPEKGIDWLFEIMSTHSDIDLGRHANNIVFYLERFMNSYVRSKRQVIRQNRELRKKIVCILTFMVERSSVQAYMLRDMIA
ncbi:ATP-binding protein [Bacteroides intestinalis]|nr:ATP-binding protein [Bacteroides intestinalis]